MSLTPYLPQDRLRALARGETLPDRTDGSALLADISGFTPFMEGLRNSLGPRQGAEELTHHINAVFSALITEVERFGGSVISFAGDAITCWFDQTEGDAAPRAVAAAFAMQACMDAFAALPLQDGTSTTLSLKTAVASGPARRFAVGDPTIHYIDALAGSTIERTAIGEQLAAPGEILLDEATTEALGDTIRISKWRTDKESGNRYALATALHSHVPPPACRLCCASRPPIG